HNEDGEKLLNRAITSADRRIGITERAAAIAVYIQANQPFSDGNTRTATMCMYALLAVERSKWLKSRAYQAYAQVGHFGPKGDEMAISSLSYFIKHNIISLTDPTHRWNSIIQEISNI